MSILFTDPIAQVVIVDWESGTRWNLGPGGLPFLTSVSMTFGGNMVIEKFIIGLDIPYDYALKIMDPNDTPFKQKNYVKARIGYASGGFIDWYYGNIVNGAKGLSMTPDGLSGSIDINPVPIKSLGYTVSKTLFDTAGNDAVKWIEGLVSDLGMKVDITDRARENLDSFSDEINGDEFYGGLANKSVWDALKTICKENYCKFVIITRNSIKYLTVCTIEDQTKGILADNPGVPNKYVIRGGIDHENHQYPCYSFTPQGDEIGWITGNASAAASGTEAIAIDKETGEDVEIITKPEDSEEAIVGTIENDVPKDLKPKDAEFERYVIDNLKGDERSATFISAPLLPGGSKLFEYQVKQFNQYGNPGLQMEIATIGHNEEKVGNICHLHMAGLIYDGPYYIDKIVHSWGLGTWDMTLNVHRRGTKSIADEKKETKGGQMQ
jgi:hypothetical protein